MKRDMDLVRTVLLRLEECEASHTVNLEIDGVTKATLKYHLKLLADAGILEHDVRELRTSLGEYRGSVDHGHTLTWEGHEFLDTIRDPEIWTKTKSGATKVGSWSIDLLGDLAKGLIKAKAAELGLPLG